jgi:predicted RNA-binding protein YlqC (UPF0109 family)
MRIALALPLLAATASCTHGPTVKDVLVISVIAWGALDQQVTDAVTRKANAIALWREQARCDKLNEIQSDCTRANAAGTALADFVARWDSLSLTVDVVLVIWKGEDPKKVILDVAPEAIDKVLSSVKGREAQAVREALTEAKRIAKEVW